MNHKATTVGANSTNRVRLSCMRSVRGWTAFRRLQPDVFRRCALVEKRPIQLAAKSSNIRCCVYIVRFEDQRIDKIFLYNMPSLAAWNPASGLYHERQTVWPGSV